MNEEVDVPGSPSLTRLNSSCGRKATLTEPLFRPIGVDHQIMVSVCEPAWPSGKALRLVSRRTSVRFGFGSPLSSKVVVCGHCLVTLSLTIHQTSKWISSLRILMQESLMW